MSRKSSSRGSLWLTALFALVIYCYFSFGVVPKMIPQAPVPVTVEMLLQQPGSYQNNQVMLKNGLVQDSYYMMGRCFFSVTDNKGSGYVLGISPTYHQPGASIDNAVFKFKILFCSDEYAILLLQEVRSN
jgi:hypothetical protein